MSDCHFVSGSGAKNRNSQFAPFLFYNHLTVTLCCFSWSEINYAELEVCALLLVST